MRYGFLDNKNKTLTEFFSFTNKNAYFNIINYSIFQHNVIVFPIYFVAVIK